MDSGRLPPSARVFISCGQANDEEKKLGLECHDYLKSKGYSPYFAERVQSPEALTEDIFRHLKNSEYAVFIDCARDLLENGKRRGSVFVNQELAIAAFRQTEFLVFHQEGVLREGVLNYLMAKPIPFRDGPDLRAKLASATGRWRPDWRNELVLTTGNPHPDVPDRRGERRDWYHVTVRNRHEHKYARNCVAYVKSIKDLGSGNSIDPRNYELVWGGQGVYEKHILPGSEADVDAFYVVRGGDRIHFCHRPSTSPLYLGMPELQKGNYELTYLVVSESFLPVTRTFALGFGGSHTSVNFSETEYCWKWN